MNTIENLSPCNVAALGLPAARIDTTRSNPGDRTGLVLPKDARPLPGGRRCTQEFLMSVKLVTVARTKTNPGIWTAQQVVHMCRNHNRVQVSRPQQRCRVHD